MKGLRLTCASALSIFFNYGYGDYDPQPLYWKSRLIDASFPDYGKQESFDKRLSGLNIPELADGHGPSLGGCPRESD
ncbi:hypothetical protein J7438_23935 [Thalassotalea sp. G20_0]|uniref:hypothetical protein n=1 Tax=Thalassotalea sp. G20_0 TaxID=2821093 RepID=UPI001AD9F3BF|nr:hypothetical protein [Thalassotalea sp. G20_0]MBO9497114.1 hypothetical protein [Thalassotalea sp. G20_0]